MDLFKLVDASYAVHTNMRTQTGILMSMGYGMLHYQSINQNLNAKISTEAELIGMSEYVNFSVWMVMFMEAQGYDIKKNIIFQDNQSTKRMVNNGSELLNRKLKAH